MPDQRQVLGKIGESAALSYLKTHGYRILQTNYRTRFAELDIIAEDGQTLCFIEVKTRKSLRTGLPKESVTSAKQKKIIMGATSYLKKENRFDSLIRFDVAEVYMDDAPVVYLIKNAFQAG